MSLPSSGDDKSSGNTYFAGKLPIRELNKEEAILHALNRLGFGGRPGEKLRPLGPRRGLNKIYGRELMELHTLGVDGGYTQGDVIEAARAFTRWTIESPPENSIFYFDERIHDRDPKRVIGKKIKGGGMKDGGQVSDSTRATLEMEMTEPRILGAKLDDPVTQVNVTLITGLVLGSPEFQKH
jgi:hypothetical protein